MSRAAVLPAGSRGCDTSAYTSPEQARALVAAGMRFIVRSVGHSSGYERDNLSATELQELLAAGLAVGIYQLFRKEGWSAETGLADAKAAVEAARLASYPPGCVLWFDLEGNDMTAEGLVPYAAAAATYTREQSPYWVGAYRVRWAPETLDQLRAAGFSWLWDAADTAKPLASVEMSQAHQTTVAGVVVDPDTMFASVLFCVSDEVSDTVPSPPPDRFCFVRRSGEDANEALARCWEEALAGGRMGHTIRSDWYKSFVNATTPAGYIGGHPVEDISSWATSCLITQEAALHHVGWRGLPPTNGQGFFAVLGGLQLPGDGPFIRGDLIYFANTGTDGHVVCLLEQQADNTWRVAAGGGGKDGTECDISDLFRGNDHYGRLRQGGWRPSRFLP